MTPTKCAARLLLATILFTAFDQNLDLAAALARVEQAREAASAAGAQLLATLISTRRPPPNVRVLRVLLALSPGSLPG